MPTLWSDFVKANAVDLRHYDVLKLQKLLSGYKRAQRRIRVVHIKKNEYEKIYDYETCGQLLNDRCQLIDALHWAFFGKGKQYDRQEYLVSVTFADGFQVERNRQRINDGFKTNLSYKDDDGVLISLSTRLETERAMLNDLQITSDCLESLLVYDPDATNYVDSTQLKQQMDNLYERLRIDFSICRDQVKALVCKMTKGEHTEPEEPLENERECKTIYSNLELYYANYVDALTRYATEHENQQKVAQSTRCQNIKLTQMDLQQHYTSLQNKTEEVKRLREKMTAKDIHLHGLGFAVLCLPIHDKSNLRHKLLCTVLKLMASLDMDERMFWREMDLLENQKSMTLRDIRFNEKDLIAEAKTSIRPYPARNVTKIPAMIPFVLGTSRRKTRENQDIIKSELAELTPKLHHLRYLVKVLSPNGKYRQFVFRSEQGRLSSQEQLWQRWQFGPAVCTKETNQEAVPFLI